MSAPAWSLLDAPVTVGDAELTFVSTVQSYEHYIDRVAWQQAKRDPMLCDDLRQAARIALWDMDPSRLAGKKDQHYVRTALRSAMTTERDVQWRDAGGVRRRRAHADRTEAKQRSDVRHDLDDKLRSEARAERRRQIRDLVTHIRAHCAAASYVLLDAGGAGTDPVFIRENHFARVVAALSEGGVAELRGVSAVAATRLLCRVVGEHEAYLRSGRSWIPGYLSVPVDSDRWPEVKSSAWRIEVGDRLFRGGWLRRDDADGTVAVQGGDQRVGISIHAWQRFVAQCSRDRQGWSGRYAMSYGRRHALLWMARLVRDATRAPSTSIVTRLFAPRERDTECYVKGGWVFVVAEGEVETCYFQGIAAAAVRLREAA